MNLQIGNTTALSTADRDLWRNFQVWTEQIKVAVERDLATATMVSAIDHDILSRLAEAKAKSMRQQQLCNLLRWDRTRLSHHLTRLEGRGLVKRSKLGRGGTLVTVTAGGLACLKAADPIHADAVMRHFVSKLTQALREEITSLMTLSPEEIA